MSDVPDDLENLAAILEGSEHFRVLRRFSPGTLDVSEVPADSRRAVFLDLETTGLDTRSDEVIELAMLPFRYTDDGRVFGDGPAFSRLRDPGPGRSIGSEVSKLTGIYDHMVRGKQIDTEEVRSFLEPVDLIVAHNASFDRPFFEKTFPELAGLPWACSSREVQWHEFGVTGRKLEYIAYRCGFFFDGHRAEVDCHVGVHVLGTNRLAEGRTPMASLLESAARTHCRLWAYGSPFEQKDRLKERRYRFDGGSRTWYRDLREEELESEKEWLAREIYRTELERGREVTLGLTRITARERYSSRARPAVQKISLVVGEASAQGR